MELTPAQIAAELTSAVETYQASANLGILVDRVRDLAARVTAEQLADATVPFRDMPEVVIPAYELIVTSRPNDAQSMVILANAYWLTGRGPEVVGALASRAMAVDANNRGAWHLWALAEGNVRARVERWRRGAGRFPGDQPAP